MEHRERLPDNLLAAYETIQEEFPDADVELSVDVGVVKLLVDPRIDVNIDIEDVDDWREKKESVREIARDHEQGDQVFYTHVDRRRDE